MADQGSSVTGRSDTDTQPGDPADHGSSVFGASVQDSAQPYLETIARLETATEGGRELDAEIECVIRSWRLVDVSNRGGAFCFLHNGVEFVSGPIGAPYYTTSVDAAMTLVPLDRRREHTQSMIGKAPTPALALCIAALKARAASLRRLTLPFQTRGGVTDGIKE